MCDKNTEAHARHIKHPLCHNKAHREEEVGCRNKRQDYQRQGLKERDKKNDFLNPSASNIRCLYFNPFIQYNYTAKFGDVA